MRLKELKLFQDSSVLQDQDVRNCVTQLESIEVHCRRFHDWNTSKDNANILSFIDI